MKKLLLKTQKKTESTLTQTQRKKWITFTYHSSLTHEVTNLFKSTGLNRALRVCNTIYNQLSDRKPLNKMTSSGIYKLQCKTCNKSYIGQTESSIEKRHRERTRYIKTNKKTISAYTLHVLNNRHEYVNPKKIQLLRVAVRERKRTVGSHFHASSTTTGLTDR